ncbi:6795_t:CDS:2 [Entrophospora sp. SA101]|nr:143_t:CDS:2 [Entrophospora sp. SA101]CAJ0750256.1 6795_t:CDS:2 [Entrophospora sp. SA101]
MKIFAISAVLLIISTVANARFFQEERSPFIKRLENFDRSSTVGGFLADISGTCIDSLVAAAPPCSMQDQCDKIIDVAKSRKKQRIQLIKIAQGLLQAEKNTPAKGLRSVDCNRLPRHAELNGLFARQDPSNGPGRKMKPFVPKKFTKIRNFILKIKGKIISPGRRFQRAGPHKRGVTPKFSGKIDGRIFKREQSTILSLVNKIDRSKLNKAQKDQLTNCIKTLKENKKSKLIKADCERLIQELFVKSPKKN